MTRGENLILKGQGDLPVREILNQLNFRKMQNTAINTRMLTNS